MSKDKRRFCFMHALTVPALELDGEVSDACDGPAVGVDVDEDENDEGSLPAADERDDMGHWVMREERADADEEVCISEGVELVPEGVTVDWRDKRRNRKEEVMRVGLRPPVDTLGTMFLNTNETLVLPRMESKVTSCSGGCSITKKDEMLEPRSLLELPPNRRINPDARQPDLQSTRVQKRQRMKGESEEKRVNKGIQIKRDSY